MKNFAKLSLLIVITTFTQFSYANSVVLIKGTVQDEAKTIELSLKLDDNNDILSMTVSSQDPVLGFLTDDYLPPQVYSGIVLYAQSGRDIVELNSRNFSSHQGGHITLSFLYNGITGSRRAVEVNLYRDGNQWKVSQNGSDFSRVHFIKNKKRFIGVVGVRRIEFN